MTRNADLSMIFAISICFCSAALAEAPMNPARVIACAPGNPRLGAALVGRDVWITEDEGRTWGRAARLPVVEAIEDKVKTEVLFETADETVKFQDDVEEFAEEERVRRVDWGSDVEAVASLGDAEEAGNSTKLAHLAVSDSGAWAVALDGYLFVGGPAPGIGGRIFQPDVRGIAFDRRGFLWAAAGDEVIFLGRNSGSVGGRRRWKVTGAGAPRLVAEGILVPGNEGIWTAAVGGDNDVPRISLRAMQRVDAAAVHPLEEKIYFASLGRLRMLSPQGRARDIGPAPAGVERVIVDARGGVMVYSARLGWLEKSGDFWRPLQVVSLAADAQGRIWRGTAGGPAGPLAKTRAPDLSKPPIASFLSVMEKSAASLEETLGPPPCRTCSFALFPKARLFFGWARGGYEHEENDFMENRVGAAQWVYLGFELTWSFGPMKTASCLSYDRRWNYIKEQRARKLEALWRVWAITHYSKPLEEDAFEEAASMLEEAKLEEIIRVQANAD